MDGLGSTGDDAAAGLLESQGPRARRADRGRWRARLDGAAQRPPAEALSDWTAEGSLADVGAINDRAYTFGGDSFSRALTRLPEGAAHVYVVSDGGAPVGCLLVIDHEGNSEIQMVAVVPEARGRGIAGKLLAHALADAAERGNETATLIATPLGYPVYERAGFEPLERVSMWERRPTASQRRGLRHVVALGEVDAHAAQQLERALVLHELGDRLLAQAAGDVDDRLHDSWFCGWWSGRGRTRRRS